MNYLLEIIRHDDGSAMSVGLFTSIEDAKSCANKAKGRGWIIRDYADSDRRIVATSKKETK